MNFFSPLTLSERLAFTLGGLARVVAACSDWRRPGGALAVWVINLVWTRVKRTEGELQRLLVRFRAGTLRVGASAVPVAKARGAVQRNPHPTVKLPRRFAWLIPLVPYEAAGFASQLRAQLEDPEMMELLRVSAQARRVLAPVCRMLGIEAAVLTPAPVVPTSAPPPQSPASGIPRRKEALLFLEKKKQKDFPLFGLGTCH